MLFDWITAIGFSVASYHVAATKDYNQVNPGVFVESSEWVGGVYRNSFDKTTVMLTRRFAYNDHVGVLAGVCSGYDQPVCAAAYARYGKFELVVAPPGRNHKGVLSVVLRIPLKGLD